MKIQLGNLHARVVDATEREHAFLREYLVFEEPKARFTAAVANGDWDGKRRMYDVVTRSFMAGLLPLVRKGASAEGLPVVVDDLRKRVEPMTPAPALEWLRDYQREAVERCLAETRGILWHPTGAGKTSVLVGLATAIPCRWLILTDQIDLLNQIAARFAAHTGEKVGRVGDGSFNVERVTVATFQAINASLLRKPTRDLLASVGGLVIDEIHVTGAATYQKIGMKTPNAYWRFGLSATPIHRGDRRNVLVAGITGPIIHKLDAQKLIADGVLAQPRLRFVAAKQPSVAPEDASWQEVYKSGIVDSSWRNALVVKAVLASPKPCLVFIKEIAHGRTLLREIGFAGLRVDFVWGADGTVERRSAVEHMVRGDLDVLVTSAIFNKGVDIPEVLSVVVAAGGRDVILALQRLGRGMRVAEGKTTVDLWDFDDDGHRWLRRHSRGRRRAYEAAGYMVERVTSVVAA